MLLPKFDYHEPKGVDEACEMMAELGDAARPIAGGTDLIVNMKKGLLSPGHVVSLGRIADLQVLDAGDGTLTLGGCVTAARVAESEQAAAGFGALAAGAGVLGSPLIRNLATVAGNLVSARPAADLPPPLMACGAEAVLKSVSGERFVPLEEFFEGPGQTVIRADELLTHVRLRKPGGYSGSGYEKLGVRRTLEISLVNVAAFLSMDDPDGPIREARIVLGAVAPKPVRAPSAEKALVGEKPTESLFVRAGEAAIGDCSPIDDFRGSAEYRRDMVAVLTKRALIKALEDARRA